jgi:hypothetical protein
MSPHVYGRRIRQARNQHEAVSKHSSGFLLGLFFDHEDGADMFLWNVGYFQLTTRSCASEGRYILFLFFIPQKRFDKFSAREYAPPYSPHSVTYPVSALKLYPEFDFQKYGHPTYSWLSPPTQKLYNLCSWYDFIK